MGVVTSTFVFCDLVGSTAMFTRVGEESAERLRTQIFDALDAAVAEHGGRRVKSTGDGTMTVFAATSDAVAASVALQHAASDLTRRHPGVALRVGVSLGDVVDTGDDFFGAAVVEAARLCDAAAPGEILVNAIVPVVARGRGHHRFGLARALDLKGLGQVDCVAVEWEERDAAETVPPALRRRGDLVGREQEVERLLAAWRDAMAAKQRGVFVEGEPGIGKTTLAAEAAAAAARDGAMILFGRCREEMAVPYEPFSEALTAAFATAIGRRALGALGERAAALAPIISGRVGDGATGTASSGDPDAERAVLVDAVDAAFTAVAAECPVLLVLDDVHWASPATSTLLRRLLEMPDRRMLVVATCRDTDLDPNDAIRGLTRDAARLTGVERMTLSGLDAVAVGRLAAAALGNSVDDLIGARIHAETGGNPFFVGELLAHLRESDKIDTSAADLLPSGARDVLQRRLDRLAPATRTVLAVASVVGLEFDLRLIRAIEPSEAVDALDEAFRARLVIEAGRGRYAFVHALVRRAVYDTLTPARRADLHRRVGDALEAGDGASAADLFHHFYEAAADGDPSKAGDYALAAAREAAARFSYDEALAIVQQGIEALELAPMVDRRRRCDLLLEMALAGIPATRGVARNAGRHDAASRAVDDARAIGSPEHLARAAVAFGTGVLLGTPEPAVLALYEEALAALPLRALGLRGRLLGSIAYYHAWVESDLEAARSTAKEAIRVAAEAGDDETVFWAHDTVQTIRWVEGDPAGSMEESGHAIAAAARAQNAPLLARGYFIRAARRLACGDRDGFEADLSAGEATTSATRSPAADGLLSMARIAKLQFDGRLDEAVEVALAIGAAEGGGLSSYSNWSAEVAVVWLVQGRFDELREVLRDLADAPGAIPAFRFAQAAAAAVIGVAGAAAALEPFLDPEALPTDATRLLCVALLVEAVAAIGGPEVPPHLEEELAAARIAVVNVSAAVFFGSVARYRGMLAFTRGDIDVAVDHLRDALALETRIGAKHFVPHTQLWLGRALLSVNERPEAVPLLESAAATARELGLRRVLAEAKELLSSSYE